MDKNSFKSIIKQQIEYEKAYHHNVPIEYSGTPKESKAWKAGYIKALENILFSVQMKG